MSATVDSAALALLATSWKLLLARGCLGLLFGVVAIAWPIGTTVTLAVLWGVWALVDGVGLAVQGWRHGGAGQKAVSVVVALVSLLVGLYVIVRPGASAVALTWALGIWLVVRAVVGVVSALARSLDGSVRAVLLLSAAVDLLLGVLFMANPGRGAVGIAVTLGLVALVWGVALVVAALVVRSQEKDLVAAT